MLPARRTRVIGRSVMAVPACLLDHQRGRVRGTPYPAARPLAGSSVRGQLLEGLTRTELTRLDVYEGELYRRALVNVETERGSAAAFVYLIGLGHEHRLSDTDWSFEEFLRQTTS